MFNTRFLVEKISAAKLLLVGYALSLFPMVALVPISVNAQTASVFSDVNTDTNYVQAITYLKDNHIVQGYPDGSYGPQTNINRAEFAKILVGAISSETPSGKDCFPDVKDEWFAPYICSAKKLGLIDGYPDGTFKPAEPVNFSEAAKMIVNAFHLDQTDKDPSVWFKQYIAALQKEKAIPLTVEYFDEKITRDEMAEIIWRIKADITDKSSRTYQELMGDGLVTASSCNDLEERFKNSLPSYGGGPIMYQDVMPMPLAPAREGTTGAPAAADAVTNSKSAPAYTGAGAATDFSQTNLQVEGVDEADIIKNDGKYIYLIKDNTVRIVLAYPASSMKEIINFQLGPQDQSFYPSEMYVTGDKLVVMGTAYVDYPIPLADTSVKSTMPIRWGGSKSKVYIVDIADRAHPKVIRNIDFDGNYQTSRRIGNNLYIVLNQYPYIPYYTTNAAIDNFTQYLPKMTDSATGDKVEDVSPCNQIKLMPKPHSFNFVITAAIPLDDTTKKVSRSVLVGDSNNVYASENNLYIASTDWSGPYSYTFGSNTKLYKFTLSNGTIAFASEGLVPGTIINQFSMDEFLGNFRIATSQDQYVMSTHKIENNLYVLDKNLKTLGKIENISSDEQLYAVRFMGERAYLVTFKTVDPLITVDLKDPANPKLLGELKIPGFSDYLQPYDSTHLIGFGKDVDPAEAAKDQSYVYYTAVKGFKLGLFDVTDPAKPKELFKQVIGDQGTYSDVLYNHKALLFDKTKNLLAFPITETKMPTDQGPICSDFTYSTCPSACTKSCVPKCTYQDGITTCDQTCDGVNSCQQQNYIYPQTVFVGAYVYGVDLQNGFTLKGKITHLTLQDMTDLVKNGYADWSKTIQRILYIGDTLYTVSPASVKANSLSGLIEIAKIDLAGTIYNLTYGKEAVVSP